MSAAAPSPAPALLALQQALHAALGVHPAKIDELRSQLQHAAVAWEDSRLEDHLQALHDAVADLPLRDAPSTQATGWFGRAKAGGVDADNTALRAQADKVHACAAAVATAARWMTELLQESGRSERRLLADFGVECESLAEAADRCRTVWQQVESALGGSTPQSAAAREGLVALHQKAMREGERVARLDALAVLARQACQQATELAGARAALAEQLERQLVPRCATLERQLSVLRGETHPAARSAQLQDSSATQKDLLMWAAQASAACLRMHMQEHTLARSLSKLQQQAKHLA